MKKLYTFSRRCLLAALMLLLFITNSCKKDALIKNPGAANVNATRDPRNDGSNTVNSKDILDWVAKQEKPFPLTLQWDNAQQATVLGQYAVKIPVSNDAALFFTKKDNVLYTYIYRWVTTNSNDPFFTGRMVIYNLQTDSRYRLQYINGEINYIQVARPLANRSTFSNKDQTVKSQGLGYILRYIGCILSGGDWIYGYYGDYCQSTQGFEVVFEDGGPGDAPPPIPQSAWDTSPGYNFSYYNANNGSTQPPTNDQLSQMGSGVFWVKPPTYPGDDNNGCQVVNESIKTKTTNDIKVTQDVKIQNTGGCPQWTPYSFEFTSEGINVETTSLNIFVPSYYRTLYPHFCQLINELYTYASQNPDFLNPMIKYIKSPTDTRFDTDEKTRQFILDHLKTWNGTAPRVLIEDFSIQQGHQNDNGYWQGGDQANDIHISSKLAQTYENYSPPYIQPDGFRMFFVILLCHEFIHWADAQDYLAYSNDVSYDVGDHFEFDILGGNNELKGVTFKINHK